MVELFRTPLPGNPPGWAISAIQNGLRNVGQLPDATQTELAICERHYRGPGEALVTAGSTDAIWRAVLAAQPRHAVTFGPGGQRYHPPLLQAGCKVTSLSRSAASDWSFPLEQIPLDCDLLLISRPDDPTGALDPRQLIQTLRRPGLTIIVDESLIDFYCGPHESLADLLPGDPHGLGELVVTRSLSSVLSIPGVRSGYLLGSPTFIARARACGPAATVSTAACELAGEYCRKYEHVNRLALRTSGHRSDLIGRLGQIAGVRAWPSEAPFVLARLPAGIDAAESLSSAGFKVVPGTHYAGLDSSYFRVSVRIPATHLQFAQAVARIVSETDALSTL